MRSSGYPLRSSTPVVIRYCSQGGQLSDFQQKSLCLILGLDASNLAEEDRILNCLVCSPKLLCGSTSLHCGLNFIQVRQALQDTLDISSPQHTVPVTAAELLSPLTIRQQCDEFFKSCTLNMLRFNYLLFGFIWGILEVGPTFRRYFFKDALNNP